MSSQIPDRVAQHVAEFNAAVQSGDWGSFTGRFAPGAVMRFTWQDGLIASLDVTFDPEPG